MNEKKSTSIKGLIFREFFLGRKSYASLLIMSVVVPFMFMLFMLSAKFGNLRLMEDVDEIIETIYIMSLYMPAFIFSSAIYGILDAVSADFNTKWNGYMFSTPVKAKKFIGIKFGIITCFTIFSVIMSILSAVIFSSVAGKSITSDDISIIMCIIALCDFAFVFYIVLAYALGINKATSVFSFAVVACILGALFSFIKFADEHMVVDNPFEILILENARMIAPFTPVIIIATIVIGYILCVKFSKRRER